MKTQIVEQRNFLSRSQCAAIIEIAKKTGWKDGILGARDRVADVVWLYGNDEVLVRLRERVAEITGLAINQQEVIHITRYGVGGEYKAHHDYFGNTVNDRTKTALVYLNDDFDGGETFFPVLNQSIHPEAGKLVLWDNQTNGMPNADTLHAGLPVTKGTKYLLSIWIRQNKLSATPRDRPAATPKPHVMVETPVFYIQVAQEINAKSPMECVSRFPIAPGCKPVSIQVAPKPPPDMQQQKVTIIGAKSERVDYFISVALEVRVEKLWRNGGTNAIAGVYPAFNITWAGFGPGTELAKLITKIGFKPRPGCQCERHTKEMNWNGPDWCSNNIDTIAGWLKEEAKRAGYPFAKLGAKLLIQRAIRRSSLTKMKPGNIISGQHHGY